MIKTHKNMSILDFILMLILVTITVGLLFFTLHKGHNWGDDFSAYMAEGIALSQGTFTDQTVRNGQIMGRSAPIVYVWGFPLLLSLVHRCVGFETIDFSTLIYYKIPGAVSLVVLGVILYLFLIKRFNKWVSFTVSLFFSSNPVLLDFTNSILSDLPFAALCWISMYKIYIFLYADFRQSLRRKAICGAWLGIFVYLATITRYAGVGLLIVLGIVQVFEGINQKNLKLKHQIKEKTEMNLSIQFFLAFLPYLMFIFLYFCIGLFMPYAKTQAKDVANTSLLMIFKHMNLYYNEVLNLISSIFPVSCKSFGHILLTVTFLGIITAARKELPALIYLVGTLITVFLLPYFQGLRYILNIVPCMLLFFVHGLAFLWRYLSRFVLKSNILFVILHICKCLLLIFICLQVVYQGSIVAYHNMRNDREYNSGAYSQDAINMYQYIQQAIKPEESIAFIKARALSLNTNLLTHFLYLGVEDIPLQADYLLLAFQSGAWYEFDAQAVLKKTNRFLEKVYENQTMKLYRIYQ